MNFSPYSIEVLLEAWSNNMVALVRKDFETKLLHSIRRLPVDVFLVAWLRLPERVLKINQAGTPYMASLPDLRSIAWSRFDSAPPENHNRNPPLTGVGDVFRLVIL